MDSKYFVVFDDIKGDVTIRPAVEVTTENVEAYLSGLMPSKFVLGHADTFEQACIEMRRLRDSRAS